MTTLKEIPPTSDQAPQFYYAGFWRRFGAFQLDWLLVFIIWGCVTFVLFADEIAATDSDFSLVHRSFWVYIIIAWLYWAGLESSPIQATLGKWLAGMKVTNRNLQRASFLRVSVRHLAKILSALVAGLGFFMIGFQNEKRALHDDIAKCEVVNQLTGPAQNIQISAIWRDALLLFGVNLFIYRSELTETVQHLRQLAAQGVDLIYALDTVRQKFISAGGLFMVLAIILLLVTTRRTAAGRWPHLMAVYPIYSAVILIFALAEFQLAIPPIITMISINIIMMMAIVLLTGVIAQLLNLSS